MPQSTNSWRVLLRLFLFTLAGWVLWALGKESAKPGAVVAETATTATPDTTRTRSGFSKRRLATSLAFATLFFAGAAFSAGAGDLVVGAVEGSTDSTFHCWSRTKPCIGEVLSFGSRGPNQGKMTGTPPRIGLPASK